MKGLFKQFLLAVTIFLIAFSLSGIDSFAGIKPRTNTVTFYDSDESILHQASVTYLGSETKYVKICDLFTDSKYNTTLANIKNIKDGYAIEKWQGYKSEEKGGGVWFIDDVDYLPIRLTDITFNMEFRPIYSSTPVSYPINYNLNGGSLSSKAPTSYTVKDSFVFTRPTKNGCSFIGWYLDKDFTYPVTEIKQGTWNNYDSNGNIPFLNLYAKFENVAPGKLSISTLKNTKTGTVKLTFPQVYDVTGIEVTYATNSKFSKNVHKETIAPQASVTFSGLSKTTYYFKARGYNYDSNGEKAYGSYSAVKAVKVTKAQKEVTAKSNSIKLKSVKVASKKYLKVDATAKSRLKSNDDFYYLVKVDPNTGKYLSVVSKTSKTKSLVFKLPLTESNGTNLIEGKYAIAIKKTSKTYMLVSSASFISNPEAAATRTAAYPKPVSKKGRQGLYEKELGDKNYFFNIELSEIIASKGSGEPIKYNGKTYYFRTSNSDMDNTIKAANRDGGTVTIQVMLKMTSKTKKLIKGTAAGYSKANYYAFNMESATSRNQIEAAFMWLARRYGANDMHVDNWILGNEVNSYKNPIGWYWAGNVSSDEFVNNYAQTFRCLYYAVRSYNKNCRVFTCVEHTWNDRGYEWGAKNFLTAFNSKLKSIDKNIKWNLAYHAYSSVLTNADFWNDNTQTSLYTTNNTNGTDYVSPLNLEVMTSFVRKNFGKNVHIILSEQAFSSTAGNNPGVNGGRAAGEDVQAAAIAYLFYKAMFNPDIDAVIFAHPVDNLGPGMDFAMKSQALSVYKYMDTPSYSTYTTSCLGTINRTMKEGKMSSLSWNSLVPKFDNSALKKMPNR